MRKARKREDERLNFSDEEADCRYVVNLLLCCGEAVKLGYMKPFTILHSDIALVKANIQSSPSTRPMLASYTRYIEYSRKLNLFNGE